MAQSRLSSQLAIRRALDRHHSTRTYDMSEVTLAFSRRGLFLGREKPASRATLVPTQTLALTREIYITLSVEKSNALITQW